MPNTEARAWWTDAQHLRPDDDGAARSSRTGRFERHRGTERNDDRRPALDPAVRPHAGGADRDRERRSARRPEQAPRHDAARAEPLQRSDAAGFAAALDLEGAFAAPAATGRTIVLERERRPSRDGGERATVQITGRPGVAMVPRQPSRLRELEARRPQRRAVDRFGAQPDRVLMWAVLLGLFLVVLATTSGPN